MGLLDTPAREGREQDIMTTTIGITDDQIAALRDEAAADSPRE